MVTLLEYYTAPTPTRPTISLRIPRLPTLPTQTPIIGAASLAATSTSIRSTPTIAQTPALTTQNLFDFETGLTPTQTPITEITQVPDITTITPTTTTTTTTLTPPITPTVPRTTPGIPRIPGIPSPGRPLTPALFRLPRAGGFLPPTRRSRERSSTSPTGFTLSLEGIEAALTGDRPRNVPNVTRTPGLGLTGLEIRLPGTSRRRRRI